MQFKLLVSLIFCSLVVSARMEKSKLLCTYIVHLRRVLVKLAISERTLQLISIHGDKNSYQEYLATLCKIIK